MRNAMTAAPVVNDARLPRGVRVLPSQFFASTSRRIQTPRNTDAKSKNGGEFQTRLPATGVIGLLRIMLEGTITVTLGAGTVTTGPRYPYGAIDGYLLQADQRADVFRVNGLDLHVLRAIRHPSSMVKTAGVLEEAASDTIPGGFGEGNLLVNGANDIVLSWEIPVAIDDPSLIGSLFAQSDDVYLTQAIQQDALSNLLVAAGGATIDSFTGTWWTQVVNFEVPKITDGEGTVLAAPDISVYHAVHAKELQFSAAGEQTIEIPRGQGQLDRLLIQVSKTDDDGISTNPYLRTSPDLDELDEIRIEYGAGVRQLVWSPAHFLAAENVDAYGALLPYRYLAIDLIESNPSRDIIHMPGVTDLQAVIKVNSAVAPAAGARVRLVSEMLLNAG